MKQFGLILIALLIIAGCNNNSPKVKTMNTDSTVPADTMQKSTALASNTENDLSALKPKTCFFSANYGDDFIYIIDEQHCLVYNRLCRYNYYSNNKILEIFQLGVSNESSFEGFFKVFSGRACRNELSKNNLSSSNIEKYISNNEDNPSFALMAMFQDGSPGNYTYTLQKSSGRWLYISSLNANPFQSKALDKTIVYLINDLKNSLQNSEYKYLQTENKVDIIKSIGQANTDALLANKVDYNYNSLITGWEKINDEKNNIENFINNQSQNNVNYEAVFPRLIKSLLTFIQLNNDNDEYNKKLDNEVLPIVKTSSEETN